MFELGQKVTVITDRGTSYDGYILARATSDEGTRAYKIALHGAGPTQTGQWHKASDIFTPEQVSEDSFPAEPPGE